MEKTMRKCPNCGSLDLKSSLLLSAEEIAMTKNLITKKNIITETPENYFCKKCGYCGPVFKIEKTR